MKSKNPRKTTASRPDIDAPSPAPELRPSTILLSVVGMSPAVITETIWALSRESDPVIPERVIVVTTSAGRREILRQLFQPLARFGGNTAWDTLRIELQRRGHDLAGRLRFGSTADDIRVITSLEDTTGRSVELADIRSPKDSEAAADFLLEQVRTVVENPDTRLIGSIAGGRKTMGALLYACMTLAARESDRLTHVLVSDPFETLREFYFPDQPGDDLPGMDGSAYAPTQARLELADVTFVALRNLFVRELGRRAGTFSRLVETCRDDIRRRSAGALRVSLDAGRCELDLNGRVVKMGPKESVVLLFLAQRAKNSESAIGAFAEAVDPINAFLKELRDAAPPGDFSDWRHSESLQGRFDDDQEIRRALSNLRKKLADLGSDGHALIDRLPKRGRFDLDLPASQIQLKD